MSDWEDPPCRGDLFEPGRDCPDCLARLIDGPDHCRACGWVREDEWYPFEAPRGAEGVRA